MAYILRSLAVVGVIALNSPVHDGKSEADKAVSGAQAGATLAVATLDAGGAANGLTAAREAAQILAGLDPETRKRMLALAAAAATGKAPAR